MRTSNLSGSLLVFCLVSCVLHEVARAVPSGDLIGVPPFNINQKDLQQHLKLGDNIKFDVPALYVFGDSVVDSGNNKFYDTQSRANYAPYGIDFNGGEATGRFTNGRTEADFIAQVLGLPFPPPSLSLKDPQEIKKVKTGVNYGSNGCGILPYNSNFLGDCLSLDRQIDGFEDTIKNLKDEFNSTENIDSYLSKSLFFINTANADLSLIYNNQAELRAKFKNNTSEFAQYVCQEFSSRLQRLYKLGARKFLVNSAGALGCVPEQLASVKPKTQCVEEMNNRAIVYNKHLSELLPKLQSTLSGSKFVFGNVFKVWLDLLASPASYGITDTKNSCCIDMFRNQTRPCDPNVTEPCKNRNDHLFFDAYHPSEATHFVFARRCLKESSICSPINLVDLLKVESQVESHASPIISIGLKL